MPVLGVFYLLPDRLRIPWLFAASLVFYLQDKPLYALLFLAVILWSWCFGLAIERSEGARRKALLLTCVTGEIVVLCFFKYGSYVASHVGDGVAPSWLVNLAFPVGISFYSFQAISYAVDVYRGTTAQRSFVRYGMYLSFFPQLIAGPIVRYTEMEAQLDHHKATLDGLSDGMLRFSTGLCKKVLLANTLGQLADHVFGSPEIAQMSSWMLWLGAIAYTLQIYYDFSGYSDMAIGLGAVFGFRLPENFDHPYMAGTATEFWRRWHMTLSRWFRDYVYIPLGGNRKGRGRQCVNLMVVWALTGIWHGAGGTFLLWGLLWGVLLMAEKFVIRPTERGRLFAGVYRVLFILWVVLLWVLFRAPDLPTAARLVTALFRFQGAQGRPYELGLWLHDTYPYLLAGILLASNAVPRLFARAMSAATPRTATLLEAGHLVVMAALTVLAVSFIAATSYNPFLYYGF